MLLQNFMFFQNADLDDHINFWKHGMKPPNKYQ